LIKRQCVTCGQVGNVHVRDAELLLNTKVREVQIEYSSIRSCIIVIRFNAILFKVTVIHVCVLMSAPVDEDIKAVIVV
jgi:hypothetical protein